MVLSCETSALSPRGATGGGKDKAGALPFALAPSSLPTHGCSRAKSKCCRAPSTAHLSPPGSRESFPSPEWVHSASSLVPPPQAIRESLPVLSSYSLAVGWGGDTGEVSSAPAAACETEGTSAPGSTRTPPPFPPYTTVWCPGLLLPSSSSSSPSRQQLTPACSDLSCVKRGQFSAPLHQTHPRMGEEAAGVAPSDVPGREGSAGTPGPLRDFLGEK